MPAELKTSPDPAREPQAVFWLLRSRRVPAPRVRAEKREPALPTPIFRPPAATLKPPVKLAWALSCITPLPVLLKPPAEPTMPCRTKPAWSGETSVAPLMSKAPTSIVLVVAPKSTRPSMVAVVPTLAEVTVTPPVRVRTPRAPAREVVLNVRTKGVPVPPRLLKIRPAWVLLPK